MAKNTRLISLDIFRGLTVAFMIFVITPGSWKYVYAQLRHAEWDGCTLTDLVFPFFLFIVGVSMWFSLKKYGHELNSGSFLRILRRTASIFALGLFLNIFPHFFMDYSTLRIMGVLQRIAIAYCIGALICITIRRDYLWIVLAVLLLFYWGLMGIFGSSDPYSLEGNFALKIDQLVLGKNHLYTGFGIPFEPEGLLSTITSVCTVIIGYYVGEIIGKKTASGKTALKILLIAVAASGLGLLWNMVFPINKPLWTSSYVLYTGGTAMMIFSLIYFIVDVLKFQRWGTFFVVFGINALFAYFLADIWTRLILLIQIPSGNFKLSLYTWIYEKLCVPVAGDMNGSLMFAIIQTLFIWVIVMMLYRKKIMIRL